MNRLRRLVRQSRPRFWVYLAGPALVGVVFGASSTAAVRSPLVIGLVAYFLVPANVFLYGINDVFDADVDRENPKKSGRETRYRGATWTLVAVAGGGVLGFALLAVLPPSAAPYLLGFLVLGAAYSAPPLRFKTTPVLDSVSNGLYVLPAGVTYATVSGTHPPLLALLGGWLWTMAMHTFSALPDIGPDRRAGIRTTATVLGRTGTLGYCLGCWLLSAATFGLLDARIGGLLFVYPLFVAGIAATSVDIDRAYWWFPAVNTTVGMVLTLGGLWRLIYG
jgi:4-hydroxybenzoate polyprenyltransferase